MSTDDSVSVVLTGRAAIYRICQNLFGNEPKKETLESLVSPQTFEVMNLYSQVSGDYEQRLKKLLAVAHEGLKDEDAFINILSNAFTRLFVGPSKVEVNPWESAYYGSQAVLFQASTLEVRKAYVKQDLIPSGYPNVADDHIGIELDFMSELARRVIDSYETEDINAVRDQVNASKDFLNEHLLVWIPAFSDAFKEVEHGLFYREAADFVSTFLEVDRKVLSEIEMSL